MMLMMMMMMMIGFHDFFKGDAESSLEQKGALTGTAHLVDPEILPFTLKICTTVNHHETMTNYSAVEDLMWHQ